MNVPWAKDYPIPKEMTGDYLQDVEDAFVAATRRSVSAGCEYRTLLDNRSSVVDQSTYAVDFIEIHGAHGYLLSSFLSPLTNTRSDAYGGQSFENRTRFLLRVVKAVRSAWGDRPLFVRLSATDWAEGPEKDSEGKWLQWGIEQTVLLSGELKKLGVDLVDVSSGGNWEAQKIPIAPGYQVRAIAIRKKANGVLTEGGGP